MTRAENLTLIIRRLIQNMEFMLGKILFAIPIAVIAGVITWWIIKRKRKIGRKEISSILLSCYISIIIQISILFREYGTIFEVDIVPFNLPGGVRYIILYSIANTILFLPVGILLPIIWDRMNNIKKILFVGFLGSFFIEVAQLVLRCGVCQTEDIIMNTVGAAVGYWIYRKFINSDFKN